MSIKIKSKITPNYDWKSILLEDITGTGITGYGNNQTPATYRDPSNSNTYCRVTLTSPSNIVYGPISLNHSAFLTLLSNGLTIDYLFDNGILGLTEDDYLEDGLWKIDYDVVFDNEDLGGGWPWIVTAFNGIDFTFDSSAWKQFFINNSYLVLYDYSFAKIAKLNINAGTGSFEEPCGIINSSVDIYFSVYTSSLYVPIAKSIKECLDNKIADITDCECTDVDCELVNKYLLYDAMYVNCKENNATKAQQIFDLLTTYCTDNCGC